MRRLYPLINAVFHAVHVALITFVLVGWMFPATRLAHLVLVLLTLGSWFVLGIWMGRGYCPVTDWHWKIKERIGEGRPPGTYIETALQRLMPGRAAGGGTDRGVVVITFVVAVLSLLLNVRQFLWR